MALGYSKLGRNSAQRKALLRDLLTDLIINERIETTLAKAKELKRLADKMVTLGKANTLSARIRAAKMVRFNIQMKAKNNTPFKNYLLRLRKNIKIATAVIPVF